MMYDEIIAHLKNKYNKGATQKEIADAAGCSHQYISRLLNGTLDPSKMSLKTFCKLFPDARIVFGDEARVIGDVTNNKGQVVNGDVHGSVASSGSETAADFLKRIMDADNIDAETKVKIYRMMK